MNSMAIKSKRIIFAIMILTVVSFLSTTVFMQSAYASPANKLTESLGTTDSRIDIIDKVDEGGYKIVETVRSIAIVAAVIFIVWAGIVFWGAGGNPGKISEAKGKLIWFFIALVFIFMAENIFTTLANFFGISLN